MTSPRSYTLRGLALYVGVWAVAIAMYVRFAHRLNVPWWSMVAVALFGAFIGACSGRGGLRQNLSRVIWSSVAAVLIVPVIGLVGVAILSRLALGVDYQLQRVSYDLYRRRIDMPQIDPQGAEGIYFSEHSRSDYRISFWKMTIGSRHYERLLDARQRWLLAEKPSCFLEKAEMDELVLAEFLAYSPEWWKLPQNREGLSVHALRCDDGRGIKTTYQRGAWFYDRSSRTLWIVEK